MPKSKHILFICSANRLRSPTAEAIFSDWPGIEVASAGLDQRASVVMDPEMVEWADTIFVMEKAHRSKLSLNFRPQLKNQKIICLNIPDDYDFMQPELIKLLRVRVTPHLPPRPPKHKPLTT
jgi:predicted protein tyrosine phosphatase